MGARASACAHASACVRVCPHACVCACVRVCVCVCVLCVCGFTGGCVVLTLSSQLNGWWFKASQW